MAEELPPDADLDDAFTLPENIEDQRWRNLYEVLIARMRREAQHLSMNTVQQLLIERIAYNYIVLRVKEAASGTSDGFAHATAQKEFNTFWLSMTQEFNRNVRTTDAEARQAQVRALTGVINAVLDELPDPELQRRLRARMIESIEDAGIL